MNTNVCFFQCMRESQVGQHFNLRPNFELHKRRNYPIIPTGMRSNIKGRWQPGHQCESFHCLLFTLWLRSKKTMHTHWPQGVNYRRQIFIIYYSHSKREFNAADE